MIYGDWVEQPISSKSFYRLTYMYVHTHTVYHLCEGNVEQGLAYMYNTIEHF